MFVVGLAFGYFGSVAWHGMSANTGGPNFDDAEWAMKAYWLPRPHFSNEAAAEGEFRYETTVPSLYRWYAGLVIRVAGVQAYCIDSVSPREWFPPDIAEAAPALLPRYEYGFVQPVVLDTLRPANVFLYAIMLCFLFAIAYKITGKSAAALFTVVVIAISPTFWDCVAWRMGPDALLCLMFVVTLAGWLWLSGWKRLVLVSVFCGLACATKQNGVLLLAAWCGYLVFSSRGARRVLWPLVAVVLAGIVFCAVNPSTWHDPWRFLARSVWMRRVLANGMASGHEPRTWWRFLNDALPLWPIVPVYLWLLWGRRREKWFGPIAWWSIFLLFGTLLTIPATETRYLAPLELGLYFTTALCLVSFLGGERWTKLVDSCRGWRQRDHGHRGIS
jgi:hypothetical protein